MYLYKLFVGTYSITSLVCFVIEMICPSVRHNEIPRQKILRNYDDMIPMVTLNLAIAYPYYYYVEPLIIYPSSIEIGLWWYLDFMYYFIWWLFLSDVLFYTIHRTFHIKQLYWLHSRHHKYRYTHGLGAIYASVPDFVICNLIAMTLPIYIMEIPYDYVKNIVVFASFVTVFVSHSGFKWFDTHLLHHLKYTSNYGLLISDRLMGTWYSKN